MQYLPSIISQVIVFTLTMVIGYILGKFKLVPGNTDTVLSKIASIVINPAYCLYYMSTSLTLDKFKENWTIIAYGFGTIIVLFILAILITPLFTNNGYVKKIYHYSFTVANFGYFGLPLVTAVFGADAAAYMMLFTIAFNIFIYTYGYAALTNSEKKMSIKQFINPVFISLFIGIALGLLGIQLPTPIANTASSLSGCLGPFGMLIAGIVISKYNIKKLLLNVRVIIASVIRLIVLPCIVAFGLKLCGASQMTLIVALGTTAMPLGLNTVVFPASVGQDTSLGASMTIISSILCIITIPLIFVLFL